MAILLKTTLIRVSSIQIMQVRVQNKGKSVWKSRYVGDVSRAIVGETTAMLRWRSRCQAGDDGDHDSALDMEIKGTR